MTITATRPELLAGLAEVLYEIAGTAPEKVLPEASFDEDLDIDSLTMVEVVVACEEKFDVRIPDELLEQMRTVGEALDVLSSGSA